MTEIEALEGGAPTLVERAGAAFDKFARAAKVGAICCGAACCCRRCRCCRVLLLLLLLLLRAGRRGSTERSVLPLGGWSKEPNLGTACRTAPALFGGRGGKCLRCLRAKETQVATLRLFVPRAAVSRRQRCLWPRVRGVAGSAAALSLLLRRETQAGGA